MTMEVSYTPGDFKNPVAPGPGPKGPGIGNSEELQDAVVLTKDEDGTVTGTAPVIPQRTEGLKEGVSVPYGGAHSFATADGEGGLKDGTGEPITGPDLEDGETAEVAHNVNDADIIKSGTVGEGDDAIAGAAADQTADKADEDKSDDETKDDDHA